MGDKAGIHRSVNTIRTELEYLRDTGVVGPHQFDSIMAQLPANNEGAKSGYVDMHFVEGGQQVNPQQIAQQAQDPNHPAHPNNPKHHEWAKGFATRLGNAATFGAGATMGADLVNKVF